MIKVKDASIVICSIVRNAAWALKRNIPEIERLAREFRDYRVIVFENDSSDGTKDILRAWASSNPLVNVSCRDFGTRTIPSAEEVNCNPFYSIYRIGKMATFRNYYLDFLENSGWNPDLLMVVDLDVVTIPVDGVLASCGADREWDALTAFGYSLSPELRRRYHDAFAMVELGKENVPQTEKSILEVSRKYAGLKPGDDWVRVYSAFGGLSIYRYQSVRELRYSAIPNMDPRVESRCEHFSFLAGAYGRKDLQVFIVPDLALKYQRITPGLIWRSIKRRLFQR